MKKIIIVILIIVVAGAGGWYWYFGGIQPITCGGIAGLGCPVGYECKYSGNYPDAGGTCVRDSNQKNEAVGQVYRNEPFGFSIGLPDGWKGYTVLNSQWEGRNVMTDYVVDQGAIITLRHPQWTTTNPREDMPIMIFTLTQWDDVKSGKMSLGSAPIQPSVLGQNSKYVLALPARYNYDYKIGWEEVDQLVHTLKAYEPAVQQGGTGILTGHVTMGPNCPVEREGVPCTPTPEAYASRQVVVYKADGTTLVKAQNFDVQGNYTIALSVGTYIVKSKTGIGSINSMVGTVTIKDGQTTTLNFSIDTGIR